MIIVRYLTKEILSTFSAVSGILLFIGLSNRFAVYLPKITSGQLSANLVMKAVVLYIPDLLVFLLPLSLFIGLLLALGRMHADSEITVLSACGLGISYFLRFTLSLATVATLMMLVLTIWLVPSTGSQREQMLMTGEVVGVMQNLTPGRFQMINDDDGRIVFYVEDLAKAGEKMLGIFIAELSPHLSNKEPWSIVTAEEARLHRDENTGEFHLVLNKGQRYTGIPGQGNYRIIQFEEYGRTVDYTVPPVPNLIKLKPTIRLIQAESLEDKAELQWRLALPMTVPILALLALPLSRVNPRQGRYARFLPGLISYVAYYMGLVMCKSWTARGLLPQASFWLLHAVMLGYALWLLSREPGFFAYKKSPGEVNDAII